MTQFDAGSGSAWPIIGRAAPFVSHALHSLGPGGLHALAHFGKPGVTRDGLTQSGTHTTHTASLCVSASTTSLSRGAPAGPSGG